MKIERKIVLLLACLFVSGAVWSDDTNKPAYQIADNTFFDPTKKETKSESYRFETEYRLEAGYVQHWQRAHDITFPDMYLHGVRLGATFTFTLPLHFGIETGLLYTLMYGRQDQHWRSVDAPNVQVEYIRHRVLEHNLTVPVRLYYVIPLWKELNLFFYTGPQLHIGLAETDYADPHLSEGTKAWLDLMGIPTGTYDRMQRDVLRANIQWGLGGGLEWDRYRLQSGYDFGLNNLVRNKQISGQYMSEWGWFVSFCYKL